MKLTKIMNLIVYTDNTCAFIDESWKLIIAIIIIKNYTNSNGNHKTFSAWFP